MDATLTSMEQRRDKTRALKQGIAAEVFNKKAGREVIKYSYLKMKGLFPNISESEAEELWKRNELVVS